MARSDMESAYLAAPIVASVPLRAEFSASSEVGTTRVAIMGDQFLRKVRGEVNARHGRSGGLHEPRTRNRDLRLGGAVWFAVAQCRVADARGLVGERASCLVVIRASLHGECSMAERTDGLAGMHLRASRAQDRARAVGEQHAQVALAAPGHAPEMTGAAGRTLFRREPEQGGEVPRLTKVADLVLCCHRHRHCGQQAGLGTCNPFG